MTIALSTVAPDFEDLRQQFQNLLQQYPSWKDRLLSSSGQMLLDFVAGTGAYDQLSIERAIQEAFFDTAVSDSAVYAGTRQLGVRIKRKVASQTTVSLVNPNPAAAYLLPAYSVFQILGKLFFNADPIAIPVSTNSVDVVLYEGYESTDIVQGTGQNFQVYQSGPNDFTACDQFVRVIVDNVEWTKTQKGLWKVATNAQVFYEATTSDGRVEIKFGNGTFGYVPAQASQIQIKTYITTGDKANNFAVGSAVKCLTDTTLQGLTTSATNSGEDINSLDDYRYLSPRVYAAGDRAVTRDDWIAVVTQYPGVIDAKIVGEAELGPSNPIYQNAVGIILLLQPGVVKSTDWLTTFQNWLLNYQMFGLKPIDIPSVNVAQDFAMDVIGNNRYTSNQITNAVTTAIQTFFQPQLGSLGKSFYLDSLYSALDKLDEVKHVTFSTPTKNVVVDYKTWVSARNINFNSITY